MLKKCPIIKHCAFANTGFVTGLLSKFKQFTSFDLNYRQISLDFSQNYKEQGRRRQRRRARVEQLVKCSRFGNWGKEWMQSIQRLKDLSPKQLETREKIESKVGGLK